MTKIPRWVFVELIKVLDEFTSGAWSFGDLAIHNHLWLFRRYTFFSALGSSNSCQTLVALIMFAEK